jgi:hypothetical protein
MCVLSCPQKSIKIVNYDWKTGCHSSTNLWVDQPKMRDTAPHLLMKWKQIPSGNSAVENRHVQHGKSSMGLFHSNVKLPKDSNPKQMPKSWKTGKYESTSSKSWENVSIFLWTRICLIYWTCWFTSQRYRIPTDTVYICIPFVSLFSAETWQSNTMFQCFRLLDRARKRETSMGKTRSFPNQILGYWCLFYQANTWGCLKFGNPKSPSCGSVIIMFPMKKALDWGCTILR